MASIPPGPRNANDLTTARLRKIPGCYPLVNIQKAIENGHRNSGFSQL
jgi:hypothetical protein